MKLKGILTYVVIVISVFSLKAQVTDPTLRSLYAETKQVNQFFRRFNNEEGVDGNRYYKGDTLYRNPKNRVRYLKMLFDLENKNLSEDLKSVFIKEVTNKSKPQYLEFHGGKWFAQVSVEFLWQGREETGTLFFQLQEEKVGSKWIISHVNFPPFSRVFSKDTSGSKYFLHPLSHEIEFMNLYKVFQFNKENIESYTARDYEPDQLTMFLYEVKKGNLQFKTVNDVKFHFFQLDNWYFELKQFNRAGNNSGWLISNLIKVTEKEKQTLQKYIYDQNE